MYGWPVCRACSTKESHWSKKERRWTSTGWGRRLMSIEPGGDHISIKASNIISYTINHILK